jgi:thioredoxin 1
MKNLKLVKYGHEYCGPCKTLKPILENVVKNLNEILDFEDKDTYEMSPEEIMSVGIKGVPSMILFKEGVEVWRHTGLLSGDSITSTIKSFA